MTHRSSISISAAIAKKNDTFRQTGQVSVTMGVYLLEDIAGVLQHVKDYTDFTHDEDPYGEHDFGSFEWHGEKIFWKIDYYDESFHHWCDPLDCRCERLLTILLASEY